MTADELRQYFAKKLMLEGNMDNLSGQASFNPENRSLTALGNVGFDNGGVGAKAITNFRGNPYVQGNAQYGGFSGEIDPNQLTGRYHSNDLDINALIDRNKRYNAMLNINLGGGFNAGGSINPEDRNLSAGYRNGNFSVDATANPYERMLMLKYGGKF